RGRRERPQIQAQSGPVLRRNGAAERRSPQRGRHLDRLFRTADHVGARFPAVHGAQPGATRRARPHGRGTGPDQSPGERGTLARGDTGRRIEKGRPRARAPLFGRPGETQLFSRRLESAVPIELKVVTIWLAEVNRKKLSGVLAQSLSICDMGSPPVLTWTV